jgi:hypothetical protein
MCTWFLHQVAPAHKQRGLDAIVAAALLFGVRKLVENATCPNAAYWDADAPVAQPGPNVISAPDWSQADVTFRLSRSSLYDAIVTAE